MMTEPDNLIEAAVEEERERVLQFLRREAMNYQGRSGYYGRVVVLTNLIVRISENEHRQLGNAELWR